ncbi:MAG: YraN family protein [Clostridiales Family XIII bacterium]|jgi:putative endonuclease|nr:YraN family protein [Clostridiales Family XIII bacterium]
MDTKGKNDVKTGKRGSQPERLDNLGLGTEGEAIAREMFEAKGFIVIAQNYRCKVGEIDLICVKGKLLVFCEVKSRRSLVFGIPAEAVNAKKIRHIRRVASWYLSQKMCINRLYNDFDMRFDVVEAVFVGSECELNHVENAF